MDEDTKIPIAAFGIIVFIVVVISFLTAGVHLSSLGSGEHSGFISAIDQRGFIFRNYEVYFKTDNSSSQEDVYCINRGNTQLIELAQKANQNRQQVTIKYEGVRGIGFDLCRYAEIKSIEVR